MYTSPFQIRSLIVLAGSCESTTSRRRSRAFLATSPILISKNPLTGTPLLRPAAQDRPALDTPESDRHGLLVQRGSGDAPRFKGQTPRVFDAD